MIEAGAIRRRFHGLAQCVRAWRAQERARPCCAMAARPPSARPRSCWRKRAARASLSRSDRRERPKPAESSASDVAINLQHAGFRGETKKATGGKGAEVIIDMVAGDYIQRNYEAAAMDGPRGADRLPAAAQGDGRLPSVLIKRFGTPARVASAPVQDKPRSPARSRACLAADRRRQGEAGDLQDLPLREAAGRARPDGNQPVISARSC